MLNYRKRLKLITLDEENKDYIEESGWKRATVDDGCPECGYNALEFRSIQLRS